MTDAYDPLRRDIGQLNEKLHDMKEQRDYWRSQVEIVKQERDEIVLDRDHMRAALQSIAKNTCCDGCREAALVAQTALGIPLSKGQH